MVSVEYAARDLSRVCLSFDALFEVHDTDDLGAVFDTTA
jgi:hypothetical protein